jgi:hypothetical protein
LQKPIFSEKQYLEKKPLFGKSQYLTKANNLNISHISNNDNANAKS